MTVPLVTGATGFAGGHLVEHLLDHHPRVAAWGHPGGKRLPQHPDGRVSWSAVDVTDRDAVERSLEDLRPSAIYHCAGIADVHATSSKPTSALRVNVFGTHTLLESLERLQLEVPVLVTGSAAVYRPSLEPLREDSAVAPATLYGVSKLAQEMVADRARGHVILTRPFNHVGPRQSTAQAASSFARQIAEAEARGERKAVLAVGNVEARRDITDVRDTVRAYRLLLERGRPHEPYNVCRGEAVRIGDLLDSLIRQARVSIEVTSDRGRFRPNDNPVVLGDPGRLARDTGWAPTVSIDDTLSDLLDYWRRNL